MPLYLRQSTASQEIPLGYFVDNVDGDTEETALTINASDIRIWKTGASTLVAKNSGGATHDANGIYIATLDATDTDTIGPLIVLVHKSGALALRIECCVLDEAVYDVMFGTSAPLVAGTNTGTTSFANGLNITGGTNGDALVLLASTSGHGFKTTGVGSAKHGINAAGGTNASGISAVGNGTGHGILLTGGASGKGLQTDSITVSGATTLTGVVTASNASNVIVGVADDVLDDANGIETGTTPRQALRAIAAACAGKLSGARTGTEIIAGIGIATARITATCDEDGNRTAITLNL